MFSVPRTRMNLQTHLPNGLHEALTNPGDALARIGGNGDANNVRFLAARSLSPVSRDRVCSYP